MSETPEQKIGAAKQPPLPSNILAAKEAMAKTLGVQAQIRPFAQSLEFISNELERLHTSYRQAIELRQPEDHLHTLLGAIERFEDDLGIELQRFNNARDVLTFSHTEAKE